MLTGITCIVRRSCVVVAAQEWVLFSISPSQSRTVIVFLIPCVLQIFLLLHVKQSAALLSVVDDMPWWHPLWFIWSLCDSLSASLYLVVCSRQSDSAACFWRSMALIRIYITSISCPDCWQWSVRLSFAAHYLWICALLSRCDCLWHWRAFANSVRECDWP